MISKIGYSGRFHIGIFVLAAMACLIALGELMPIGLLANLSQDLEISLADASLVVSVYAWCVGPSAILLTALTARLDRKHLLLVLLTLYFASNAVIAFAGTLETILAARVVGAMSHGVFWAVVAPIAVRLVRPEDGHRATAIAFAGISFATVVGVPLGAYVSNVVAWRVVFGGMAVATAALAVIVVFVMPRLAGAGRGPAFGAWKSLEVTPLLLVWLVAIVCLTGNFGAFTFISPYIADTLGYGQSVLPIALAGFGVAGVLGNMLAASLPERAAAPVLATVFAVLAAALVASNAFGAEHVAVAGLVVGLWGIGLTLTIVLLQVLVLRYAGRAPEFASSIHTAVFNLGIGAGSFMGGLIAESRGIEAAFRAGAGFFLAAAVITTAGILLRGLPGRETGAGARPAIEKEGVS